MEREETADDSQRAEAGDGGLFGALARGLGLGRGGASKLRPLSGFDAAFLAAETRSNPLHMMAILVLDPGTMPGGDRLELMRDFFAERLHSIPPLRRRLVEVPFGLGRPSWVLDQEVDLQHHIRRAHVRAPGGVDEIARIAADMMATPLDRRRPMWEMRVVEGMTGGRIALVCKLHHASMDGMAGMRFMASIVSREPEWPRVEPRSAGTTPARASRDPGAGSRLLDAATRLAWRPLRMARTAGATLIDWARAPRVEPSPQRPDVPRSGLNVSLGEGRSIAIGSLSMTEVRRIARLRGVTVNDVVLCVVGGALRDEMQARGELPAEPLVAAVPISLHEAGDDLTNAMSAMVVSMGTDVADPLARLGAVHASARAAKLRQQSALERHLDEWIDLPTPLELNLAAALYGTLGLGSRLPPLCNAVVSNVPGPPVPLHLAGARILGLHPLGPIYDGVALNVTLISCEDRLDFGLVGCARTLPDLGPLARSLSTSLEALAKAVDGGAD